jgi:tetratricopeptide (TPR) repeat protein
MTHPRLLPLALAALACLPGPAARPAEPPPDPGPLARAREAYERRAEPAQAKAALDLFAAAAAAEPQGYDARWEGARACYFYGNFTREEAPDGEKMALFQDGIDRAKAAVALRPEGVEGHFWLGVLYGVYGEAKGIFKALGMVPDIRREMGFCLTKDETVECFGAHRVLGRLYYKLPGFKGGDNAKSLDHLERAVKGCPTNALAKLYLAETLEDEGQEEQAIALLKEVIAAPPDPRWVPEHPYIKAQAERLLRKWS